MTCNSRKPLKAGSQTSRLLAMLVAGHAITPQQAYARLQCLRLSARVLELRQRGHDVVGDLVKRGGKVVAQYRLAR